MFTCRNILVILTNTQGFKETNKIRYSFFEVISQNLHLKNNFGNFRTIKQQKRRKNRKKGYFGFT